jgi:hypothetical protein
VVLEGSVIFRHPDDRLVGVDIIPVVDLAWKVGLINSIAGYGAEIIYSIVIDLAL